MKHLKPVEMPTKSIRKLLAKIWKMPSREDIQRARLKAEHEAVITKLTERAKSQWPNNLHAQNDWIIAQLEAYQYMQTAENKNLKKVAQEEWPLDYTAQKLWYHEILGKSLRPHQKKEV